MARGYLPPSPHQETRGTHHSWVDWCEDDVWWIAIIMLNGKQAGACAPKLSIKCNPLSHQWPHTHILTHTHTHTNMHTTNMNTYTQAHTCTQTTHTHTLYTYPHTHNTCIRVPNSNTNTNMNSCTMCVCVLTYAVYVYARMQCMHVWRWEWCARVLCVSLWMILTCGWWHNALKAHLCWLRG